VGGSDGHAHGNEEWRDIVDVCLQSTDRDEMNDVPPFYEKLIRKIKAPIMIDTTDPRAMELALTYCQGKSLINSINLETARRNSSGTCPVARRYGAALGGLHRRRQAAGAGVHGASGTRYRRSGLPDPYEEYRHSAEDIVFRSAGVPCLPSDANYIGGGRWRRSKGSGWSRKHSLCQEVWDFPYLVRAAGAAREVVNWSSYYCTSRAGSGYRDSQKLERFASIPAAERQLARTCCQYATGRDPCPEAGASSRRSRRWRQQFHIAAIAEHSAGRRGARSRDVRFAVDQRLANYIIEGTKTG